MSNRKERRAAGNREREPVITVRVSDIERMKARVTEQATEQAVLILLVVVARVLRDKLGFHQKRLDRVLNPIIDWISNLGAGEYSIDEVIQSLEEEDGIHVKDLAGGRLKGTWLV